MLEFYIEYKYYGTQRRDYFAVNEMKVTEIIPLPSTYTALHTSIHPAIMGTFALRGKVTTLIDLCYFLYKTHINTRTAKAILFSQNDTFYAFAVNDILHISNVPYNAVKPINYTLPLFPKDILVGIVKKESYHLYVLDLDLLYSKLFSSQQDLLQIEEITKNPSLYTEYPYTILYADDSSSMRSLVSQVLTQLGYVVYLAKEGNEAYALAQQLTAKGIHIACCIIDVEMPVSGGYTFVERMHTTKHLKHIPIIFYSALQLHNHTLPTSYYFHKTEFYQLVASLKEITNTSLYSSDT